MADPVDDLIATARPRTQEVQVCARGDLVDRHLRLSLELGEALQSDSGSLAGPDSEVARIHDEIHAVEEEQERSTTTFTLQAVGPLVWANLLRDHRPRPGRDHNLTFNLATFPPAAVAACVVDPPMTVEQATKLYGTDETPGVLHSAEWDKLIGAAYVLNEKETDHPKLPAAIDSRLQSARSSATQPPEASPAPSSSDGNEPQ